MKASLLIISLALCQIALSQRGGWTVIDPNTVDNNKEIQDNLIFGAHSIIDQAVETFVLENANYDVTRIFKIWQQQIGNGTNYAFDVEISGSDGNVVKARYIVNVQDNTKRVLFWSILTGSNVEMTEGEAGEFEFLPEEVFVEEEEQLPLAGGFIPVDPFELLFNIDLQNALDFGVLQVIRRGLQDGKLPRQRYRLDKINSIQRQEGVNTVTYRFDVGLKGRRGTKARAVFEVETQLFTGVPKLTSVKIISVS